MKKETKKYGAKKNEEASYSSFYNEGTNRGNKKSVHKTATGGLAAKTSKSEPIMGDKALDKEIAGYCQRSETRRKGSFNSSYEDGKELDRLIGIIEGDKYSGYRKRPNLSDPFLVIASHKDCKVRPKQLRRQWRFFKTVNAMKEANIEPPVIGVTFYSEATAKLKAIKDVARILQKCLDEDLSIRDLLALLGEGKSSTSNRNWRDHLDSVLNKMLTDLGEIEDEWKNSKEPLGESKVRFEELTTYIQTTFLSGKGVQ